VHPSSIAVLLQRVEKRGEFLRLAPFRPHEAAQRSARSWEFLEEKKIGKSDEASSA